MTIQITNAAATYINKLLAEKNPQAGFCLSVKKEGCSGIKYIAEVAEQAPTGDKPLEINGIKVFLMGDKNSFQDVIVDFVKKDLGLGRLIFHNPHAKGTCGCGESFLI
ncbi:MAG: iron-sulfur cluster assembly accessory protein [Gammaproteobacteria bacterium]